MNKLNKLLLIHQLIVTSIISPILKAVELYVVEAYQLPFILVEKSHQ